MRSTTLLTSLPSPARIGDARSRTSSAAIRSTAPSTVLPAKGHEEDRRQFARYAFRAAPKDRLFASSSWNVEIDGSTAPSSTILPTCEPYRSA